MSVARTLLISLATPSSRIDVVADSDVPISRLFVSAIAAPTLHFYVASTDTMVSLVRAGDIHQARSIHPHATLAAVGARDGDLIYLHPAPGAESTSGAYNQGSKP